MSGKANVTVLTFDQSFDSDTKPPIGNSKSGISEVSCDVSVDDLDKQEWCFTLYDFDGHGKITREDLASLMHSIYEMVGSTVKLPPSGSKTMKLRLSVVPESKTGQVLMEKTVENKENTKAVHQKPINGKIVRTPAERLIGKMETGVHRGRKQRHRHHEEEESPIQKRRSRSDMGQRTDLTELLHRNADRHPYRNSRLRRHHSDQRGTTAMESERRQKYANNRDHIMDRESRDRRNHYLDLAGVENYTSKLQESPIVPQSRNHGNIAPLRSKSQHCSRGHGHYRNRGHHRSRSYDPANMRICENLAQARTQDFKTSELYQRLLETQRVQNIYSLHKVKSPKACGELSAQVCNELAAQSRTTNYPINERLSPSTGKHKRTRHREQLKQQISILEQEFVKGTENVTPEMTPTIIQRHEHHHHHQHHHHYHYHHYHET
uniref:Protein naked cuticle homolog n=2 Tax=Saccoglossus kowalevskii TaxID=10224 RepID=A0ABM0MIA5_SACKO|nr:PREDICTED: naked cuticle-like protein isoform X1 [Saccoglossus kowalevskii]